MQTNVDFKTVVPAAQAGDKAARDALMTNFYAWSVTQARAVVHEAEAAKNVAVDFWTWMFTDGGLGEYDAEKGAFYPWMAAQIRHIALAATKKGRPKINYYAEVLDSEIAPDDAAEPLENLSEHAGVLRAIEAIADMLPQEQRKNVYRRVRRLIKSATAKEIADEFGPRAQRVRKLVKDVRDAINERLAD